jgi:FKBP-type peptidyl-prolyl cis-trans isomerase
MIKRVLLSLSLLLSTAAAADDFVKLRYTIFNGEKVVDQTQPGTAAVMALSKMMPGWRAGVEQMNPGEKRRITVSAEESGGKMLPGTTYEIETELVEVIKGPETPADLTPPASAERSRSGLAWQILQPGSGPAKPNRRSTVRVNYSGWTSDGRLFDSTILRGQPAEFRLDRVIAGWTEGLQLMTAGEVRRFWIPAKLAYEKSDGPQGLLVFDIELIEIK